MDSTQAELTVLTSVSISVGSHHQTRKISAYTIAENDFPPVLVSASMSAAMAIATKVSSGF